MRGQDGIDKRIVVIIGILRIARHAKEQPRELEHIIDVARLAVAVGPLGVEHIVRPEMFPLGIAARHIGVPLDDRLEKHTRNAQIALRIHPLPAHRLSVQDEIAFERAQDLGNGRIRMTVFEDILPLGEDGVKERLLVKDVRGAGKPLLPRAGIQLIETVVHAAVFHAKDARRRLLVP